jgi:bacterioferritin-associated ferredoxin
MTCGALQILLKNGGLLAEGAVLAGSGPLLYLIAAQAIAAGARPAAIVDTTPPGAAWRGFAHLGAALVRGAACATLWKGVMLQAAIRASGVAWYRGCRDLAIEGAEHAEAIRFVSRGQRMRLSARVIALHEGVIPTQQVSRLLDLDHAWDEGQACFRPVTDEWGASSLAGVLVAGDGAGIFGAVAALHAGRIAAAEGLHRLGRIDEPTRNALAEPDRAGLRAQRAVRPMLEAMYPPPEAVMSPADAVVVCRCENITAGEVRAAVAQGCLGPNQVKAFLRSGMGPCQGRMCGPGVAQIVARARGVAMDEVGYFRIRPPLKPVSVAELASVAAPGEGAGPEGGAPEAAW